MRAVLLAALVCGGCDVLFLSEKDVVRATLLRARVTANPDGTYERTELPFPGEDTSLVVDFGDGRSQPLTLDDAGKVAFMRRSDRPYRLVFSADGRVLEAQHTADELDLRLLALGRLDRQRVTAPTVLELPRPATGVGIVMSTGLWARGQLDLSMLPMTDPVPFDWATADTLSGPLALIDATRGDRLYYFEYGLDPAGYFRIERQVLADLVMTNGGTTRLGPLSAATRDRCVHITASRTIDAQRLAAVTGGQAGVYQWSVEVSASALAPIGLQLVAFRHEMTSTDVDVQVQYANPFPDPAVYAQIGISFETPIKHPLASTAVARRASLTNNQLLSSSGDCVRADFASSGIAIPKDFTINNTPIDGSVVEIDRSADVEATWATDGDAVDYYSVTLFQVERNGANETTLQQQREFLTVEPKLLIDPDVLVRGDHYVLQVAAHLGAPRARDGDFANAAIASSVTLSSMFTIR